MIVVEQICFVGENFIAGCIAIIIYSHCTITVTVVLVELSRFGGEVRQV